MTIRLLIVAAFGLVLLVTGCDSAEKQQLQSQIDSLSIELEANRKVAETLQEVGTLLDSIDVSRRLLRVNMIEGTTYDDYTTRMKDLNEYVKETQTMLDKMEKDLSNSKTLSASYSRMIKSLRADLEAKSLEIISLQTQVDKYRNENQNLVELATLQEAELNDKQSQIDAKSEELSLLESRIQSLLIQSKMSEADALYVRAQAVEEAANRTKLAPRKKKETLEEALGLYKQSLAMGKKEAEAKIKAIEAQL